VQRALADGVEATGLTTFLIDAGMDTGPMLLAAEVAVDPDEDAGALTARLADIGARLTVETLDALEAGQLRPRPQPEDGASLAPKVTTEEARLDFSWPAARLAAAVRAFTPAPGAWTTHRGRRLKVTRAAPAEGFGGPGEPAASPPEGRPWWTGPALEPGRLAVGPGGRLLVGTADQPLELLEVRPEGRRAMSGAEFARGARLGPDVWLGR
jgi:methionyl-tRNA formyltransferase